MATVSTKVEQAVNLVKGLKEMGAGWEIHPDTETQSHHHTLQFRGVLVLRSLHMFEINIADRSVTATMASGDPVTYTFAELAADYNVTN